MIRRVFSSVAAKPINTNQFLRKRINVLDTVQANDIFITRYPGSRVIELRRPETGNPLNNSVTGAILDNIKQFHSNVAVGTYIFASSNTEIFSNGFEKNTTVENVQSAHTLSRYISKINRPSIAIYGGEVTGSAYGVFATSTYRLATANTTFKIGEISEYKTLPVGGLAYHMAQSCPEGVAVARYLAVTGKLIGVDTLYAMGLVSHVVEPDAQTSISDSLARTSPRYAEFKFQQYDAVDRDIIPELLDTICMSSDLNLVDDPLVDRVLLVPLQEIKEVCQLNPDLRDEIISKNYPSIDYCFGADSVKEVVNRLKKFAKSEGGSWATEALESLEKQDPKLVEAWFRLTKVAKDNNDINKVFESELNELKALGFQ